MTAVTSASPKAVVLASMLGMLVDVRIQNLTLTKLMEYQDRLQIMA